MSKLRVLVFVVLAATAMFCQDVQTGPEKYSAVAIGTGGSAGGKSVNFNFNIDRYTTDEEVQQLATLLKTKGQDALVSKMEKLNCGRIYPVTSTGNEISVARKRMVDGQTVITIVTARRMSFAELNSGSRSKDYPFGYLQVKLNDKGEGSGQIMVAAKIRFDKKKGNYEIESYGNQYIKAINVRPSK